MHRCMASWAMGKSHPMTIFARGEIVIEDMKDEIIDSKKRGEIARDEFVARFTRENTKLNYYDPIKWQPLKLFKKKTTKKNN